MGYLFRSRDKSQRFHLILWTAALYILFAAINGKDYFSSGTLSVVLYQWLFFGFFTFVSLLFFSVGSLVWFYARDRRFAIFLFGFSLAMMLILEAEVVDTGSFIFAVLSYISVPIAFFMAYAFLLFFPGGPFSTLFSAGSDRKKHLPVSFVFLAKFFLFFFGIAGVLYAIFVPVMHLSVPRFPMWMRVATNVYYTLGLVGILLITFAAYKYSSSTRERQQLRLFVSGTVLSVAPVLVFTLLPTLFQLPSQYIVNSQYSLIALPLFPLALGYSILRYQVLVLDSYIQRAVAFIVGILFLAMLIYVSIMLFDIVFDDHFQDNIVLGVTVVACVVAAVTPFIWRLARSITEYLFFNEVTYYRRLIDDPRLIADETIDLEDASRLLTSAAIHTFETTYACLFVLDESLNAYTACPPPSDEVADAARRAMMQALVRSLQGSDTGSDWLERRLPALTRLAASRRPLLLSEVKYSEGEARRGLQRYLKAGSSHGDDDWLLAPVRAQGKMVGVLVLGERGDRQPYAGPDFEVVQMLTTRFASLLETARSYARARQHADLLDVLYSVSMIPGSAFREINDVRYTYVDVAARATDAGAEMWVYDEQADVLRRANSAGPAPRLALVDCSARPEFDDWLPVFFDGEKAWRSRYVSVSLPSCLSEVPPFPFVWLPLKNEERRLGILVLTYQRPHHFFEDEMRVLEMFASQFVVALENVRMTGELLASYERQKELDYLKDHFIMTASHELRTPLTAVMGYIELLSEYGEQLSAGERADFIDRARRGCDELTLLVSNIMDASSADADVENVIVRPLSLLDAVMHVVQMQDLTIRHEQRAVRITIPPDLSVQADEVRLRQVLLNLITNALKYSSPGTPIEISSEIFGQQAIVCIRDYGLGVPTADQQRLFERFVRLERDLNSAVRGTGLGLAISKQLIEAMGGYIWVESSGKAGEGSRFYFCLPLVPVQSGVL